MRTNAEVKVRGIGDVEIVTMVRSNLFKCRLQNFLHVPDFVYSLILVSSLGEKTVFTTFGDGRSRIVKRGREILTGFMLSSLHVAGDNV